MAPSSSVKGSFIAKVELIQVRQQHAGTPTISGWMPPVMAAEFSPGGQQRLFRWHDGNMQTFNQPCPGDNQKYSAATIFSQGQSKALLAVLCDARSTNAIDAWGWKSLKFEAAEPPAAPTVSRVGPDLKYERLRAPGGQSWVGQLLPPCYHNQDQLTSGPTITGLVGRLPILIALAALSTSASKIKDVLSESIRGYKWIPHEDTQGRIRGMYDLDHFAG